MFEQPPFVENKYIDEGIKIILYIVFSPVLVPAFLVMFTLAGIAWVLGKVSFSIQKLWRKK